MFPSEETGQATAAPAASVQDGAAHLLTPAGMTSPPEPVAGPEVVSALVDPGGCAQVAAEVPAPQREVPQVCGWDPGHR